MTRLMPVVLAMTVLAGPAVAGDVRCLMDNLPADKRAQVEALYARDVDEGLASSPYSERDFEVALAACNITSGDEALLNAVAQAMAGYEAETGVALWLKTNRDIDDPTLQRVWKASRLADPAVAEAAAADPERIAALVFDLAARLGLESQEDLGNLGAYVSARLMRQSAERRF